MVKFEGEFLEVVDIHNVGVAFKVTQIVEWTVGLFLLWCAVGMTQIVEWTVGRFILIIGVTQIVEKTFGLFTLLGSGVGAC